MSTRISIIAAVAQNGTIGLNGGMPWHISADLRYFKEITIGAPIIMGRKTYDSIGRALPGRANIVITRNPEYSLIDALVVNDLDSGVRRALALAEINGDPEIFVIGGSEIYLHTIEKADRLYLTEIDADYLGDAFFPDLEDEIWEETSRTSHLPESNGAPKFSFVIYDRVS